MAKGKWKQRRLKRQRARLEERLQEAVAVGAISEEEADFYRQQAVGSVDFLFIVALIMEVIKLILDRIQNR